MRRTAAALAALTVISCGTQKTLTDVQVVYIETETVRTDTIAIEVPKEVHTMYVPCLDTLRMSTSVAEAWAAVDTSMWMLTGRIRNKQTELTKEVKLVEKVVRKDSIIYQTKTVEVPVEKVVTKTPDWARKLLAFNFLLLLAVIVIIYRKFRPK